MFLHTGVQEHLWGWKWRSSHCIVTFVIWLGIIVDSLSLALCIPVVPFQLKALGYTDAASLTGWLFFAYGGSNVITSALIVIWSEAYDTRKLPYSIGILSLIVSQIMFMEAPSYWVMCLARCLQGAASAARMVIGPAAMATGHCIVGRSCWVRISPFFFLNEASSIFSLLLGTPIAGLLYTHFGFRGPFVFSSIAALPILALWLLIIPVRYASAPLCFADRSDEIPLESEREGRTTASSGEVQNKASPVKVLHLMLQSPRIVAGMCLAFIHGMLDNFMQPIVPSHLNSVWGLNVSQVGLVFLAPTISAVLLSGWLADRRGVSVVIVITSALAIPWFVILSIARYLSFFIVVYFCAFFFGSGVLSPILAEFASTSRSIDGVGCKWFIGYFLVVLSPIDQDMYDNLADGWMDICLMAAGLHVCGMVMTFFYIGEKPITRSSFRRIRHLAS
ncbi:major facilitator superfamily domain-containing protein [Desarmillaria tabescens]|uniref:Major facilitator superfamily domain-containing protein n=1 Tax=Armillaria tabescens TaxID=1929756 RepID=A0AA39K9P9_ARMTA|nr:major facilitator superfamily domain-containing protein [Desarmillaria tabescens]KAK0457176.1 major facilitator superfamily domain-containing protein [Desarmillaria tabescens]